MAADNTKSQGNGRHPNVSILFHADSSDPDMRYFSRFNAFDPYLAFTAGGKKVAVITTGEYGRMVKESVFDEVLLQPDVEKATARRFKLSAAYQGRLLGGGT